MTPGLKRLNHQAWLSFPALSVPIHDGKSNTIRMSAFVRADTEARCAPSVLGEKDRMGSQVRGPRGRAWRACRCALPRELSTEATR